MTDTADELDLPRKQVGPNPQHLLITLMGDFWHGRAVAVPSSALVDVLGEFDISPASARSALSRLARRGILAITDDPARGNSKLIQYTDLGKDLNRSGARIIVFALTIVRNVYGRRLRVRRSRRRGARSAVIRSVNDRRCEQGNANQPTSDHGKLRYLSGADIIPSFFRRKRICQTWQ